MARDHNQQSIEPTHLLLALLNQSDSTVPAMVTQIAGSTDVLKQELVREIARNLNLPAADQPESQDLCYLGGVDYRDFLRRYIPQVVKPGLVVDQSGKVLGKHQGQAFYTIGQRKGLPASTQPLYVLSKDLETNTLVVGFKHELGQSEFTACLTNWISGEPPADNTPVEVKIRFKALPVRAEIFPLSDDRVRVSLPAPLRDISYGQIAVFYEGERVLGSGRIE